MIEVPICRTCKTIGRILNNFGECADCSKAHSEEVRTALGKVSSDEDEKLKLLWEIAQELVDKFSYHENAGADIYCMFCGADNYISKDIKHDPKCIVTKARALLLHSPLVERKGNN